MSIYFTNVINIISLVYKFTLQLRIAVRSVCLADASPLELNLTTSELWFGQVQEGILP